MGRAGRRRTKRRWGGEVPDEVHVGEMDVDSE